MYDEEWFLGSLLMLQLFYAKTKEAFKILVRVSFMVPTISSRSLAVEVFAGAKGKYPSGYFTGEESILGVFMSFSSLSSSAKDLVYVRYFGKSSFSMLTPDFEGIMLLFHPDFASLLLFFLKVSKELPAVEPFSFIFRSSIVVLVALGFSLLMIQSSSSNPTPMEQESMLSRPWKISLVHLWIWVIFKR
ncbi:hypothetical protein V6N12_046047 [Hibiscus sabdariffa]|uniref:Uncharacterized protein n=1 Tax=Hibiscus sabdariffa TaxID=183260 RepID=A0ABR2G560_9ROSI